MLFFVLKIVVQEIRVGESVVQGNCVVYRLSSQLLLVIQATSVTLFVSLQMSLEGSARFQISSLSSLCMGQWLQTQGHVVSYYNYSLFCYSPSVLFEGFCA